MNVDRIKEEIGRLEGWLARNAPTIDDEQRHLDSDTEARAYWHYGRLVALRDIVRQEAH